MQLIDVIMTNPTVHLAPSYRDTGAPGLPRTALDLGRVAAALYAPCQAVMGQNLLPLSLVLRQCLAAPSSSIICTTKHEFAPYAHFTFPFPTQA